MYPKPLQDLFGWEVRDIGCSNTSIVVAAERSAIAWGPSPTYGELVCWFITIHFINIMLLLSTFNGKTEAEYLFHF